MATTITANGINFPDGSASAPSIGGTDTNTGLFTGSDIVGFATGGVERIRIDANGKVKIGHIDNVNPTETLHVVATAVNQHIARFTGANKDRGLVISTAISGSTNDSVIKYDAVSTNSVGQHTFLTDGSERVRISSTGRLLVGTADDSGYSNRSAYFHKSGSWNYVSITGSGGAGIVFGDSTGQNVGNYESYMFHDNSDNHFYITTNQGNQKFTFDDNGHLGLGPNNTSPSGAIHINDSGQQNLVVGSTNAGGAYLVLDGDSNGDSAGSDYSYIGHTTSGDLELAVSNPDGNGNIYLKSNNFSYQAVTCHETGPVELRYQNVKKFETTSGGVKATGVVSGIQCNHVRAGTDYLNYGVFTARNQSDQNEHNAGFQVENKVQGANLTNQFMRSVDSSSQNWAHAKYSARSHRFLVSGSAASNTKVQIDVDGLKFNNDQTSDNALSDYEEGAWSPNFYGTSGNDSWTNGCAGSYTKIGNQVTVRWSAQNYSGNLGGALAIGGLPYSNNFRQYGGDFGIYDINSPSDTIGKMMYFPTGSVMYIYWEKDNDGGPQMQGSELKTGSYIEGNFTYRTA